MKSFVKSPIGGLYAKQVSIRARFFIGAVLLKALFAEAKRDLHVKFLYLAYDFANFIVFKSAAFARLHDDGFVSAHSCLFGAGYYLLGAHFVAFYAFVFASKPAVKALLGADI